MTIRAGVSTLTGKFSIAASTRAGELPLPASDAHGCEMLGQVLSMNGNQPQQITLANMTDGYRGVLWIGYNGDFVDIGGLNAGESITIDSYVTHPFMITDGPGNCLEVMVTTAGQSTFAITAPANRCAARPISAGVPRRTWRRGST